MQCVGWGAFDMIQLNPYKHTYTEYICALIEFNLFVFSLSCNLIFTCARTRDNSSSRTKSFISQISHNYMRMPKTTHRVEVDQIVKIYGKFE